MKRILVTIVVVGLFAGLGLIAFPVLAAPAPGTPKGKEFYSSRPKNYRPPTLLNVEAPPTTFETPGAVMPTPVIRRAPEPPGTIKTMETPTSVLDAPILKAPETSLAASNEPIQAPKAVTPREIKPDPIVITEQSEKREISSVDIGSSTKRSVSKPIEEAPKDDNAAVLNFTPRKPETQTGTKDESKIEQLSPGTTFDTARREWAMAEKEVIEERGNELDDFNARLAKIQLEKHNLAESLGLIEKIKSPNYKVKTLVDLAEYVSRDNNYKREADALYALAVDGIEALAADKPIVIKIPTTSKPIPTKATVPTRKPTILVEEDDSVKPKTEPKSVEIVPVAPTIPTIEPELPTKTAVEPVVVPSVRSPSRTPILLDDPTEKKEEPSKPEAKEPAPVVKEAEKKDRDGNDAENNLEKVVPVAPISGQPTLAPIVPETKPTLAPAAPVVTPSLTPSVTSEKGEEIKSETTSKRPSIILIEEPKKDAPIVAPNASVKVDAKEGEKKPEPVRNDESVTVPTAPPTKDDTVEKKETTPIPSDQPKTSRKRPMPGKRVVTLEDN